MRTRWLRLYLPLLLAGCFCSMAVAQAPKTPDQDAARKGVVQQGHDAYYNLRAHGLDEFQSTIKPNWEIVLKDQMKPDPSATPEQAKATQEQVQNALKLLNGLHFTMLLDKDGKVTVTHRADAEPPNEQTRQGFDQIYSGMDQAVSGFFATWSLFMLTSPFPATDADYKVEDLGSQYRLSYKEGPSDIVTLMNKDLVITEIKVNSPQFISIVKPQVTKTAPGFVLTGYVGDYTPTSGPGVVHLDVKIGYAAVNGLQLPVTLIADSVYDGTPTRMELAFSEHQVKSH
jgi:hypothetical protein